MGAGGSSDPGCVDRAGSQRPNGSGETLPKRHLRNDEGTRWQWCFTEIADDSFRWLARESRDDGESWQVRNEFFMKRRTSE
jgi:hypothetical protein